MAPVHERSRPCRGVEVTAYKQDDAAAIFESQGLGIAQTDACSASWGFSKNEGARRG